MISLANIQKKLPYFQIFPCYLYTSTKPVPKSGITHYNLFWRFLDYARNDKEGMSLQHPFNCHPDQCGEIPPCASLRFPTCGRLPVAFRDDKGKRCLVEMTRGCHPFQTSSSSSGLYAPSFASNSTVPLSRHFKLCHCPFSIFSTTPPGTISMVSVSRPSES